VHDPLLDPVRQPPRVEPVLEAAVAVVVEAHRGIIRRLATHVHRRPLS
jgi:hypothetical protein